jgi:transcriptional regulator with XRE-family HTH domain
MRVGRFRRFDNRLRQLLQLRGLQPQDLVAMTHLRKNTVYGALNGRRIFSGTAERICRALDVSIVEFVSCAGPQELVR